MDIKTLAQETEAYIIERRRFYHTCPEPSKQEKETRAHIKADLEALGITEIVEMKTCYGLTAMIRGGKPGKTVALRTDIDALSVKETTGLPFASKNEGFMHACGHDNHIAILLGAAKMLQSMKDELCGNVKLIVQPEEETATGALSMSKEGAVDDVDAIYGGHVWGDFDAPKFIVTPGNNMACCHGFKIEVEGASAHASAPHLGIDAIMAAVAIATNLQQVVSRMNNPINPLVLTIGTIHGGDRWNVLPGHCTMEGTVRTFRMDKVVEEQMRKVIETTAEGLGAKASLEYTYMTLPVINSDPLLNRVAHDAVVKLYGEDSVTTAPPMTGAEDFSWFGEKVPYFYGFIGSRNRDKGLVATNHNDKYDVDESILQRAAAVMAQFAVDYLEATAQ